MSKRRAAIIGINKYQDTAIPELKGAENDATELRNRLTDPQTGEFRFDVAGRHFLTGDAATCDDVRQAISDLLWRTEEADLCLFYFSGHGFQDTYGNGYLAPWDIRREEPLVRGIRMQELTDLMLAAKQKKTVLLVLDCCYSGIAAQNEKGEPVLAQPHVEQWFEGLEEERRGEGRIVFASAGKNEKSRERAGCVHELSADRRGPHDHGAFTYNIIEGLDGKAATGSDATVTLFELMSYVDKQMEQHDHTPIWRGSGIRDARSIVLGRASQWSNIAAIIRKANDLLVKGDSMSVFKAIKTPSDVIKDYTASDVIRDYTDYPDARTLKKSLDAKLSTYREPIQRWVQYNREEFLDLDFARALDELDNVAARLDFDTYTKQRKQMRGLLIYFCVTRPAAAGPACTEADRNQIMIYCSEGIQEGSVAKTDLAAQGNSLLVAPSEGREK